MPSQSNTSGTLGTLAQKSGASAASVDWVNPFASALLPESIATLTPESMSTTASALPASALGG
jgi:hypothetical protein